MVGMFGSWAESGCGVDRVHVWSGHKENSSLLRCHRTLCLNCPLGGGGSRADARLSPKGVA